MAQPNVAREPSMEEILASIRRIIESNEPAAENALPSDMSAGYGDDIDETDDVGFAPGMAANDRGMPLRQNLPLRDEPLRDTIGFASAPVNQPIAGQSAPEPRTLSLADVAARVRAASSRQQETVPARPAAPSMPPLSQMAASAARQDDPVSLRPQMPRMPEPQTAQAAAPLRAPQPVSQQLASQQPVTAPRINPPVFDPPQPAPMKAELPVRQEMRPEAPAQNLAAQNLAAQNLPAQSLPAKIEEAANLLSAEAGAQVAKSFSDLAAVFNGMERRSLEDMAGDMLRPMLQEWLDDNLPTLVERLVREEIERVSRGQRR